MSNRIEFELVTPEQLLVSQPVHMVVVPGGEGYYGVLAGHIPMITTVEPGVIEVFDETSVLERVFVSGGFAETTQTRITVLAAEAVRIRNIDGEAIEQSVQNLTEDLEDAETEAERSAVNAKLRVARAKLDAVLRFGTAAQKPT